MTRDTILALAILIKLPDSAGAADLGADGFPFETQSSQQVVVSARTAVIDGRTLWFPADRMLVRLADIDGCELVQWSFHPQATPSTASALAPVPCGALAKAWLKRTIGNRTVRCDVVTTGDPLEASGVCKVGRLDIALEMLRVGWAKVNTVVPRDNRYVVAQQSAFAARYGMWSTYVLDMQEWRQKAIDKTLGRRPQADRNLISERDSEISPPFLDARRQPKRRDR